MKKWFLLLLFFIHSGFSSVAIMTAPVSIPINSLPNFSKNSKQVKSLLHLGLELSSKHLGYIYGSADPKNSGMDCSGTIYYLLTSLGIKNVPRSSDLLYQWAKGKGHFYSVTQSKMSSKEFSHLNPGDILFWNGTYATSQPVRSSHVMIYLGKDKDGRSLMVGASNGRTYKGNKIYGVSVFDFYLPSHNSKSTFLGYSCIPNYSCK
jgi:hypothetical protein